MKGTEIIKGIPRLLIVFMAIFSILHHFSACVSNTTPAPSGTRQKNPQPGISGDNPPSGAGREKKVENKEGQEAPILDREVETVLTRFMEDPRSFEDRSFVGPIIYETFHNLGTRHTRCGMCHFNIERGSFQEYIETRTSRINPFTGEPFGRIESICTSCHRTLHLAHPVGIVPDPKKVILPAEAKGFRGEEDRLTCLGCHNHHPINKNYRYLRWPSDGGENLSKFCANCHPEKKAPDRIFDRERYDERLEVARDIRQKKNPVPARNPYFKNPDYELNQLFGFYQGPTYNLNQYNEDYHIKKELSSEEWSRIRAEELYFQGIDALKEDDMEQAIRSLESSMQFAGDINQTNEVILLALGKAYRQSSKYDEAEKMFKRALKIKANIPAAVFELGWISKQKGRMEDAIYHFLKAAALKPDFPAVYLHLGQIYREKGTTVSARKMFEKTILLDPDNSAAYVEIGRLELEAGHIKKAREKFQKALNISLNFNEAYIGLGECFLLEKDYPAAVDAFQKAIASGEIPQAYLGLGKTYLQLKEFPEAIEALKKASTLDENNPVIWYHLGVAFHAENYIDESYKALHRALELKEEYAEAWYEISKILFMQRKFPQVEKSLKKALEIRPDYAEVYIDLGHYYNQIQKPSLAMTAYQKAVQLKPDYEKIIGGLETSLLAQCEEKQSNEEICLRLGNFYLSRKRYQEALSSFQKNLKTNPQSARSYLGLGKAYTKLRRFDEAHTFLEKARKLIPNSSEVRYHLGVSFKNRGKLEEWRKELSQAVVLKYLQDNPGKDRIEAESALRQNPPLLYRTVIKIDPEDPETHNNLGTAYMVEGKLDLAVSEYKRALELKPDFPDYLYNIGLAAASARDYKNAQAAYLALLRIHPDHFQGRYNLGKLYQEQGMFDEAIAEYRKIISLRPQIINISLARLYRKKWEKERKREWLEEAESFYGKALAGNEQDVEARKNLAFAQNLLSGKIQTLIVRSANYDKIKKIAGKIKEQMSLKELKAITDQYREEAEISFIEEGSLEKKLWDDLREIKNGQHSPIIFHQNRYFLLYRINSA